MNSQDILQELANGFTTAAIGREYFLLLAKHLSKVLEVDYVFIGEFIRTASADEPSKRVKTVRSEVFFAHGKEVAEVKYPLIGSLCEMVVQSRFCAFPKQVQQQFPENQALRHFGVDSYAGVALYDSSGKESGIIYVMHTDSIKDLSLTEYLLRIVAKRVELELERIRQERLLREANEKLQIQLAEREKTEAELRKSNGELLYTQALLAGFNDQLEKRIYQRTEELQLANEQISQLLEREKAARLEAEDQRKQVESLFEQAPIAIAIFNGPEHIIELANSGMCDIWGKAPEELIGRPLFEALSEVKGQGFEELLQHVFVTGESFIGNEIVGKLTRKGKRENAFLNFVYQPIRSASGSVTGIIAVANEVTEQVEARNKLEASKARVQRLLDSIPQIAWTADREGKNTYLNRRWYEFTGVSPENTFHDVAPFILHPDDVMHARNEWQKSIETGQPYQIQYRIRRYDNEYRWMLAHALPLRNENGEIVEWIGTTTDIHEQKQAIDYLYSLLEGIPHLAWTSHPESISINYFNKRWYDFTGLTEKQSQEMGWQQVLHPDDLARVIEVRTIGRSKGEPYEVENRYLRASDNTYRWHLARVVPIRDDQGRITLWIGTATDIHEQKTTQHTLETTLKELNEKNFELDQFVYKTSHDLRSPLSTILGLVNIMKQEEEEANKTYYIDLIENRVHKLDKFIRSMLDYSRNTRTATNIEKIDLKGIVSDCLYELEYMKNFSRLTITTELADEAFFSDVFRLKIIFSNLISNAIKYQDFAKSTGHLLIQAHITSEQAVIHFKDNGVGIEEAFQEQIYNMFFRATEQSDGSGLGLYIVKQAVGVLQGTIRLESSIGIGTSFIVTLPNMAHKLPSQ